MAKSNRKIVKYSLLILVIVLGYLGYTQYPKLNLLAGYSAKMMSSSVFLAHRSAEFTDAHENNFTPVNLAEDNVDMSSKSVTTSVYGLLTRKAIFREGLGSVLLVDGVDENSPYLVPVRTKTVANLPYPYGDGEQKDTVFPSVDYDKIKNTVDAAFLNPAIQKTRSVLVVYKDQIIAEKYADNFDKNSILLGWSMTKSITSTIFGILQSMGKLNILDPAPIADWQNDERAKITINDLLHMNSGLAWSEDYKRISDATRMLFLSEDMAGVQQQKKLVGTPNSLWNYSSGTTNLLSGILRNYFPTHQAYLDFWYSGLIDRIGMHSMLIEADLAGNYVGSSYGWATTRDWAKFGLLYLHRGNWNGDQIFDSAWVDYVTTPTATSNGEYGGHFWLNAGGKYPDAPRDMFSANGFQGQRVFIIPSKDLVVVRMGLAEEGFDFNGFLKDLVASIRD
ncbi:beta-lactamase family protein [Flavobacteriaceae bacterium F08102]|nr:beta-lactamase family protein [Flavobacteriaceae bacterium F08102]